GHHRRAGTGPSGVTARLERAVERPTAGALACVTKRVHFGMGSAGHLVASATDDYPLVIHHERPDHRVGVRAAAAALRDRDRLPHVVVVAFYHFSSKSAL